MLARESMLAEGERVARPGPAVKTTGGWPSGCGAVLAICSDLDETPDADTYFELMRFLNTTEDTSMGPGIGLEVGNSIYFDMPPGHFSYWNTTEENWEKIRALIRSGHIDCLHSYGDLATTRAHAGRALDELTRHDCHLKVWVDHSKAPTNFGSDIMRGHGDEPGHPAYHADLTLGFGIKYVWRGRVTSVVSQSVAAEVTRLNSGEDAETSDGLLTSSAILSGLGAIWTREHPLASTRTLAKEASKNLFARCGYRKYAMHGPNRLAAPCSLRDGSQPIEFLRCNPHWGGVSCGDRGDRIHEVLTRDFLGRLVERQGACILYTHLGKLDRGQDKRRFSLAVVKAFRLLAEYFHSGKILVTTTRRLLDYVSAKAEFETRNANSRAATAAPGSTLCAPLSDAATSEFRPPTSVVSPRSSAFGLLSSAPWPRLSFPDV